MTTIHSTVEPRKHVRITAIGDEDVALDIGRPHPRAVSLVAIRVPVADLRAALDEVAPAGSYTRTESPDYADGGVTAAAIEKEVEGWRPHHVLRAQRDDARDMAALWKEAARREFQYRVLARTGREFYRDIATKFEESRDAAMEERDACRGYADEMDTAVRSRDEVIKVRQAERDEALARVDRIGNLHRECHEQRDKAWAELDGLRDEVQWLRDNWTAPDEQPRALTPDAIESVLHDILPLTTDRLGEDDIASIASDLYLALTEPTRPEGAEEIEAAIREVVPSNPGDRYGNLADRLAERGVRVTGAES